MTTHVDELGRQILEIDADIRSGEVRAQTLNFSGAVSMFWDNIDNIIHSQFVNTMYDKVRMDNDKTYIPQIGLGHRIKTIRKLLNAKKFKKTEPADCVNDDMIARAKEYPIENLYTNKLQRSSRTTLKGCCPFHTEKTPSFIIDKEKNRWRCFGMCSEGGDAIDFLMKQENIDFIQSVKKLCK